MKKHNYFAWVFGNVDVFRFYIVGSKNLIQYFVKHFCKNFVNEIMIFVFVSLTL